MFHVDGHCACFVVVAVTLVCDYVHALDCVVCLCILESVDNVVKQKNAKAWIKRRKKLTGAKGRHG